MRPAVATVLSSRPWEERLAQAAAETGLVRITVRGFDPADVDGVTAVVVGSEAPWLRARHVARWRRRSMRVIGIYPRGDRPTIARLCGANVDQLLSEDTDPLIIMRTIRDLVGSGHDSPQTTQPSSATSKPL